MRGTIVEAGFLAATNADLLTATRLQTAPSNGIMTFYMQASDNNLTDNYKVDLQLPDSEVPMVAVDVPCGEVAGFAYLDERTWLAYAAQVKLGGRVVYGLTETGDAECVYRVVFNPTK